MPQKHTEDDRPYSVNGKRFTWSPDTEEGEELPDVVLPLRIKLKQIREMADRVLDADSMASILESVAPDCSETIAEMDLNDFQAMFNAWQGEYEKLSGAKLGE